MDDEKGELKGVGVESVRCSLLVELNDLMQVVRLRMVQDMDMEHIPEGTDRPERPIVDTKLSEVVHIATTTEHCHLQVDR